MLVSIIIPVYRSLKYIEKCIRSVFEQTYKDLEIIIIDDCGNDGSIDTIKRIMVEYPDASNKVKFVHHDKNEGCAASRRDGMLEANGDYMLQIDSDDYVDSTMVENLVSKAIEDGADMVVCDYFNCREGINTYAKVYHPKDNIDFVQKVLLGYIHAGLWNKLIRMSIIKENRIFPIPGINMCDDMTVLVNALFYIKTISFVNTPLYYYNHSAEGGVSRRIAPIENDLKLILFLKSVFDVQNNKQVDDAFAAFRAGYLGRNLLYNDLQDVKKNLTIFDVDNWRVVLEHKKLPLYYKIVVCFYLNKFFCGVWLIRKLVKTFK